ncbi:uncharacterized protein LOC109607180 isoform X2 [Aethina tumida]|uniref:uncharacterized protein LOC109607180 isoform X2 n=1 Tax=Aethina tumida TaxID=116153 RepID=UPI00096B5FA6|nr:uncharacterized protein LOC109607180 isoform X2 [Aethina tumida]
MCSTAECVIDQIADCISELNPSCPTPCVVEPQFPFAACCHVSPPPILLPTSPRPVKPLQLPCPMSCPPELSEQERMELRYDNYYNNYNIDWHSLGLGKTPEYPDPRTAKCRGATLDGRNPCEYVKPPRMNCDDGCPTGFKPCAMKMVGPLPCGVWCAQIPKCTPKTHEKHNRNYTTKARNPCS